MQLLDGRKEQKVNMGEIRSACVELRVWTLFSWLKLSHRTHSIDSAVKPYLPSSQNIIISTYCNLT